MLVTVDVTKNSVYTEVAIGFVPRDKSYIAELVPFYKHGLKAKIVKAASFEALVEKLGPSVTIPAAVAGALTEWFARLTKVPA